jgi:small subunit ribosomal protein S16
MGRKKRPFYRVVVVDSRIRRDGAAIEKLGYYNPLTQPHQMDINEERALYWLRQGASMTDTVKNLFSQQGILLRWHLEKTKASPEVTKQEIQKWELAKIEREKKKKKGKPVEAVQPEAEEEIEDKVKEKAKEEIKKKVKKKAKSPAGEKEKGKEESPSVDTQEVQNESSEEAKSKKINNDTKVAKESNTPTK